MKTITINRAKEICANWHDGQRSALYQFASSGIWTIENCLRYLKEVLSDIENEYFAAYPHELKVYEERELIQLERFFIEQAKQHGITIEFHPHSVYGYTIPFVSENTPDELANQMKQLTYLK